MQKRLTPKQARIMTGTAKIPNKTTSPTMDGTRTQMSNVIQQPEEESSCCGCCAVVADDVSVMEVSAAPPGPAGVSDGFSSSFGGNETLSVLLLADSMIKRLIYDCCNELFGLLWA